MITVRKLKLVILNDNEEERREQYKFLRDSIHAQYQGLNLAMGLLGSTYLKVGKDFKCEEFKAVQSSITNKSPIFEGINFGKGFDSKSAITQKIKKDFSSDLKNGLAKGERSIRNYKRDFPLMVRGRDLKFSFNENGECILKAPNKLLFKVIIGASHKSNNAELLHTLNKIIEKDYEVKQSSLQFDNKNNLILNLTLDIPKKENKKFIENRCLGVDLGIRFPAVVCLNDNVKIRKTLGSVDDFLRVRQQMKNRRRTLQKSLSMATSGQGRGKKLKALDKLQSKERNWVKTYNHNLSSAIVKFAVDNKCEYIKLEYLTKNGFPDALLASWSYFELQSMIEYKAERAGIKVVYINPAYTSQKCSKCGCIDKENRKTQEHFECVSCGKKLNADHNAAINISRSDDIMTKGKIKKLEERAEIEKEEMQNSAISTEGMYGEAIN